MNELLRDIEEDLRQERFEQLWGKTWRLLAAISAVIVLATVVAVSLRHWRQAQAMEKTDILIQGIEKSQARDYKAAIAKFDALAEPGSSYYGIALLRKAEAQELSGDKESAAKTRQALARDKVFGALAPTSSPDRAAPFYYVQSERRAWQALAEGKKAEAAKTFLALRNDEAAPPSLRGRMAQAAQALGMDDKQ